VITTKIIEEISVGRFKEIVNKHKNNIRLSYHALTHLSNAQRKVFKEEELINPLLREKPVGVGLQQNGRYAVFYRRKSGYLRIILELKETKIEIITFINTDNIPNLKRLKK